MMKKETVGLGRTLSQQLINKQFPHAYETASRITSITPEFFTKKGVFSKKKFWNMLGGNLEEVKNVTPDVALRRGAYWMPNTDKATQSYFASFRQTPMIDVDLPKTFIKDGKKMVSHVDSQIVHKTKEDALRALREYAKSRAGKDDLFKVYDTPAGLRYFNLGRRSVPNKTTFNIDEAVGGDVFYRKMAHGRLPQFGRGQGLRKSRFDARLFPKPGREGDFVAKPLGYIGVGQPNPQNYQEILTFHDNLIKAIMKQRQKTGQTSMGGLFDLLPGKTFNEFGLF